MAGDVSPVAMFVDMNWYSATLPLHRHILIHYKIPSDEEFISTISCDICAVLVYGWC